MDDRVRVAQVDLLALADVARAQPVERFVDSDLRNTGDFNRVYPLPQSRQDVPDDLDARLVVLGTDTPYSKEKGNPAETAAQAILESRGSTPRIYRNTLVFLAADKTRLQDLDEAVRRYLAWESILGEREQLDLSPRQVKQAETQKEAASSVVAARLPETYQWLLVPVQARPDASMEWQAMRLSGQHSLATRASKKLKGDELLVTGFAPPLDYGWSLTACLSGAATMCRSNKSSRILRGISISHVSATRRSC